MADRRDIAVDFMDMTNDRRMWVRAVDARPGVDLAVGRHVIVGDDDADPRVAQIVTLDPQRPSVSRSTIRRQSSSTPAET